MSRREDALGIFRDALAALDPRRLAREAVLVEVPRGRRVQLIAVGKAAPLMAAGVAEAVPLEDALIVTKDGHGAGLHAGHPVPDARSLAAGRMILERAAAADDLLVLALSGGASALAVAPAWGLTLDEKVAATRAVAAAGADIRQLNCVRKHLSELKGGRLAQATRAEVVALVLSDVIGNDLATIGSGPVSPDPTTFADALAVCAGLGLPPRVRAALEAGARGELPETPKQLGNVRARVLAGPDDLVRAAAEAARARGYDVETRAGMAGRVVEVAAFLAARSRPFVGGGEPTVVLPPHPGRGGRAQLVALLAATQHRGDAVVLAAGSDGTDGPTADAGGLVDAGTVARAGDVAGALARFDAGTALAAAGDLVTTGPTGSNLCDLFVVLM